MSTPPWDTDKRVTQLEHAGMPRAQALAVVQAQRDAMAQAVARLPTKADIDRLIVASRADFARLEAQLGTRVEQRLHTRTWQVTVVWGLLLAVAIPITVALHKLL